MFSAHLKSTDALLPCLRYFQEKLRKGFFTFQYKKQRWTKTLHKYKLTLQTLQVNTHGSPIKNNHKEEKHQPNLSFHPLNTTMANPADLTHILTQASRCECMLGLRHHCIQLHMLS